MCVQIRVNVSTYEAWCRLEMEERTLELAVRLARSHPLLAPVLVGPRAPTPAANTHWLVLYLAYQVPTILYYCLDMDMEMEMEMEVQFVSLAIK